MRVIGGRRKGKKLAPFKGLSIRPTSDRVREAVFNILPHGFPFKRVLDLYAGTGAMGIEALSRGALEAVFVESDAKAIELIKKNLSDCGFDGLARVLRKDAVGAIKYLGLKDERFDIVFIDPPYDSALTAKTLLALEESKIMEPGARVVVESSKRVEALKGLSLEILKQTDERRYGDTMVYFFTA